MRISLTRSGGFTGITQHCEVDTAKLPPAERRQIEQLVARARAEWRSHHTTPDEFEYEIVIDGAEYLVGDEGGSWSALIERLTSYRGAGPAANK